MATTALVIGAGAAVAGAAASGVAASQGGKGGGGLDVPERGKAQGIFDRQTRRILDEQRNVLRNSLLQGSFVEPEVFALLGFDPVFAENPDIGPMITQRDEAQARVAEIQAQIAELPPGGRGRRRRRRLRKARTTAQRQLALAQDTLGSASSQQNQLIGLEPRAGGRLDPTGDPNFSLAAQLQNETLVRALRGEEPVDATLRTAFTEREQNLRERLRRQLGPDFETSTAGSDALANFDRERNEAFEQFNRAVVGQFSQLTESRASALSGLTTDRINQLFAPSQFSAGRAAALGAGVRDRLAQQTSARQEREFQLTGSIAERNAEIQDAERQAAATAGIGSAATSLAGGFTSAAGTLGGGAPAPAVSTSATGILRPTDTEERLARGGI